MGYSRVEMVAWSASILHKLGDVESRFKVGSGVGDHVLVSGLRGHRSNNRGYLLA